LGRRAPGVCLLLALLAPLQTGFTLEFVGDLPGGIEYTVAHDISGDGSTVVGSSVSAQYWTEALAWTPETGPVGLGVPGPGPFNSSAAYSASFFAGVVVGRAYDAAFVQHAVLWEASGATSLGFLDPQSPDGTATAVSGDGAVVWGRSRVIAEDGAWTYPAFRWTPQAGMESLGLVEGASPRIRDGSHDGSRAVGYVQLGIGHRSALLLEDEAFLLLGDLDPGPALPDSEAHAISADGQHVVGFSQYGGPGPVPPDQAFRWIAEEGMVGLGFLPGGDHSKAYDVSADGAVIVGYGNHAANAYAAAPFVWTTATGMIDLEKWLASCGASLGPASLQGGGSGAVHVSDDGRTIAGSGWNPSGLPDAWVLRLDASFADLPDGDLNGSGAVNVLDAQCAALTALAQAQGAPPPACLAGGDVTAADLDCDGSVDVSDALMILDLALAVTGAGGLPPGCACSL